MSLTKSFLAAIIILAWHALSSAFAQERQYVGVTTELFDGASGYFAPHRACADKFGGVWCTSRMIIENGAHRLAGDPPESGAWINPAFAGLGGDPFSEDIYALDYSGIPVPFDFSGSNCGRWLRTTNKLGFIIRSTFDGKVTINRELCSTERPAACCGGEPRLTVVPFVDAPVPPSD